MYRAV